MNTSFVAIIHKLKYLLYIFITLFLGVEALAQEQNGTKQIKIKEADRLYSDPAISDAQILQGNVIFENDGALMYCDSALLFQKTNSCEAYGHIRVNQGDSISITGDSLLYSGNDKLARLRGNIFFKEKDLKLTTNILNYDLNSGVANYHSGGTIVSSENNNKLTSNIGTYNSKTETLFFKDEVKLTNPEYTIDSDTLTYNTLSEVAFFHGPTYIRSEENLIYCEHGWYDTKKEISSFWSNTYIISKEQKLEGDSIYYDRNIGVGEAYGNVQITDTTNKVIINGDIAIHDEINDSSLITGHAIFTQFEKLDTLYLHADTLTIKIDSLTKNQSFRGFHNVVLYKNDLQARCDSIVYNELDSMMHLFSKPIIWSSQNQLTGEFIKLKTKGGEIIKLYIDYDALIVSEVDTSNYNQIKGKFITGEFSDNELKTIHVNGNGETIYFLGEEGEAVTDMNKSICTDIEIKLDSSEIQTIKFNTDPSSKMTPIINLQESEKKLEGFHWKISDRPKSREDLLIE